VAPGRRSRREQQLDIEIERVRGRYALLRQIFSMASPLTIAALYIPFRGALPVARVLAGHSTDLRLSISLSFVYSAAITVGGVGLLAKNRSQGRELERLRNRLKELEADE
jgi:hypothetical protein